MALSLRYVGARPYAELTHPSLPTPFGFGRGAERDDVPESFIKEVIIPSIKAGSLMWEVVGEEETKTKAMLEAVEEPTPEPVVEEPTPVVDEPTPEPVVDDQSQAMIDVIDEGPQFSESMSRAQMMSWCRNNGISTATTDTKASLTAKALAYQSGDAGDDE